MCTVILIVNMRMHSPIKDSVTKYKHFFRNRFRLDGISIYHILTNYLAAY